MTENENVHGVGPTPPTEEELDTLQFGVREAEDLGIPTFKSLDEFFAFLEQHTAIAFNAALPESIRKEALDKLHWLTSKDDPSGFYNKKAWDDLMKAENAEHSAKIDEMQNRDRDSMIDYQEGIREILASSVSNEQFEARAEAYLAHFNLERKAIGLAPLKLHQVSGYKTPYNGIANPAEPLTQANADAILSEALPLGPNAAKLREIYSTDASPVPEEVIPADVAEPEVVSSVSDERVVNNDTNAVRHQYRVLSDDEKANVTKVKDAGQAFIDLITSLGPSRENSLAVTKMEEGVFWAVKGLTK